MYTYAIRQGHSLFSSIDPSLCASELVEEAVHDLGRTRDIYTELHSAALSTHTIYVT